MSWSCEHEAEVSFAVGRSQVQRAGPNTTDELLSDVSDYFWLCQSTMLLWYEYASRGGRKGHSHVEAVIAWRTRDTAIGTTLSVASRESALDDLHWDMNAQSAVGLRTSVLNSWLYFH